MAQVQKEFLDSGTKKTTVKKQTGLSAPKASQNWSRERAKEAELLKKQDELNDAKQLNFAKQQQTEALKAFDTSAGKMKRQENSVMELNPMLNPWVRSTQRSQETELRRLEQEFRAATTQEDADRIKAAYDKQYGEYQNLYRTSRGIYAKSVQNLQGASAEAEKDYQKAKEADDNYAKLLMSYSGPVRGLSSEVAADLKKREEYNLQQIDQHIKDLDTEISSKEKERDTKVPEIQYSQGADAAFDLLDKYNAEIKANQAERQEYADYLDFNKKYGSVKYEKDFASLSRYQKSRFPTYDYEALYERVNGKEALSVQMDSELAAVVQHMSQDERDTYNYICAKEGKEKGKDYLNALKLTLNLRNRVKEERKIAEFSEEHPYLASAGTVIASPLKGLSYIGQGLDYLMDGKIDQNAPYNRLVYGSNVARGTVTQKIEKELGDKWGKVGSFGYQTGMSMLDFLTNLLVAKGIGAGAGMSAEAASNLSLALMGTGAAADTVLECKDRGLSDGQAFSLGTVAGLAEVVTEKVSVENLLDKTKMGESALGYFLQNVLAEGSEEVASDVINTFADILIAKDKSQWNQAIQAYESQGMKSDKAFFKALTDQAQQMGLDFAGGTVSGGIMAGGAMALNGVQNRLADRAYYRDAVKNGQDYYAMNQLTRGELARQNGYMDIEQSYKDMLKSAELTAALEKEGLSQGAIENLLGNQGDTAPKMQAHPQPQYSIETTQDGKQYVKADRQVISGNDPKQWAGQITNYINQQIRNGQDITLTTYDGDLLQITRDTAGKAQFRNLVKQADGKYAPMSDSQYAAKLRAEGHIDELAEISTRGKKTVPDRNGKHGKLASDGWNYRTAFFEDADGSYYRLRISVAQGKNGNTIYNIANIERRLPAGGESEGKASVALPFYGSSANSGALNQFRESSNTSIPTPTENVNSKSYLSLVGLDPIAAGEMQRKMAGVKTDLEKSAVRWGVSQDLVQAVSKVFGNRNVVFDGTLKGNVNGYYQDGVIHLNPKLSSSQAVLSVFGHELTHSLEKTASYRDLVNLVLNQIGNETAVKNAVNDRIELYRRNGVELDTTGAVREIVAEYAGKYLFSDEQTVRRLAQEKPSLAKKILSWIRETLAKLKNDTEKAQLLQAERLYSRMLSEAKRGTAAHENGDSQYLFAGQSANTAGRETFARAKAMQEQGTDNEKIRQETGWFRGRDGKWRFEIDDSAATIRQTMDNLVSAGQAQAWGKLLDAKEVFLSDPELTAREYKAFCTYDQQKVDSAEQGRLREELLTGHLGKAFEGYLTAREQYENSLNGKRLGDYLDHSALFAEYPELKELPVNFGVLRSDADGEYTGDRLLVSAALKDVPQELKATLLHEIQHAIQSKEGFAGGSNPERWETVQNGKSPVTDKAGNPRSAFELYENTAGEIEARNVEDRMDLTLEERRSIAPDLGDENTVFSSGDAANYAQETSSIKEQLREHQDELNAMKPVSYVSAPATLNAMSKSQVMSWVVSELKKTGFQVERQGFGTISFTQKELNTGLNYLERGSAEATAYPAIPAVLKRGIIINTHENHKGRNYKTITFAAPVSINGKIGNMAVVVKQTKGNAYKMHRLLTPDGKMFNLSERGAAERRPSEVSSRMPSLDRDAADYRNLHFDNSISESGENINPEIKNRQYSISENEQDRANAKQKVSQVRENTFENSNDIFTKADLAAKQMKKENFTYDVVTEQASMQEARERLTAGYEAEVERVQSREFWRSTDLDSAMEILRRKNLEARQTGDFTTVAEWAKLIQEKGTNAGQMIQAFAKYSRTPEGILTTATRNLKKLVDMGEIDVDDMNDTLHDMAEFTETLDTIEEGSNGDLVNLIVRQAERRNTKVSKGTLKRLNAEPDFHYLYDFALTQLENIAADFEPSTFGKKLSTYQTTAHLFNFRTGTRNVSSNQTFDLVDSVANNMSLLPDLVLGVFTGNRTVGFEKSWFSKMKREGAKQGFRHGALEASLDVAPHSSDGKTKYGTGGRRTWKANSRTRIGRAMSTIEKAMGYELNVTDEFHKGSVRGEVLESLQKFVDNGTMTQEEALEFAEQEALYRSFQDDTLPGAILASLKDTMNLIGIGDSGRTLHGISIKEFGLGDFVQKYTQVPGALISRAVEFSPMGYLKAIATLAKEVWETRGQAKKIQIPKESADLNITHPPEMQKIMQEYANAVDPELRNFVRDGIDGKLYPKAKYYLNDITAKAAKDIQDVTGIKVEGFKTVLDKSTVEHIENRHGEYGKADHSMSDTDDVARIQYVLHNYDTVENTGSVTNKFRNSDNTRAQVIRFSKRIDGTYYVAEAVPNSSRQEVNILTAYKTKAESFQQVAGTKGALPTAKTGLAREASAFDNSIPNPAKKVNRIGIQAQRKAALAIGRATTGTGLITAFAALSASGLLHRGDDEKDKDAAALNAAEGVGGTQINLSAIGRLLNGEAPEWRSGDVAFDLGFMEPLNAAMTLGSMVAQDSSDKGYLSKLADNSFESLFMAIKDTPTMQTLDSIYNVIQYHDEETDLPQWLEIPITIGESGITGFVPSLVRQAAQATDQNYRDQYTSQNQLVQIGDKLKNTIPGLRQTLPEKLDNFGNPKTYSNPWLNAFNATMFPGNMTIYKQDDVSKELTKVYQKTGNPNIYPDRSAPYQVRIGEENLPLTAEDRATYQKTRGALTKATMADLMQSDAYRNAKDPEKAELLKAAVDFANDLAKREFVQNSGKLYTNTTWDKTIEALENGISFGDYQNWRQSTQGMKDGEKRKVLSETDLPDPVKVELYDMDISSSHGERITAMTGAGLPFNEFLRVQDKYSDTNSDELMKAKDKATEFAYWVDQQGYTDEQAQAIKENFKFFTMSPASAGKYDKLACSGIGADTAYQMNEELNGLEPEEGKDQVSNSQKLEQIAFSGDYSEEDRKAALSALMEADDYAKIGEAEKQGIGLEAYMDYYLGTKDLKGDVGENGKTISGSKREKVLNYIDQIPGLTNEQKDYLYYQKGYAKSKLGQAPWHNGGGNSAGGGSRGGGSPRHYTRRSSTGKKSGRASIGDVDIGSTSFGGRNKALPIKLPTAKKLTPSKNRAKKIALPMGGGLTSRVPQDQTEPKFVKM